VFQISGKHILFYLGHNSTSLRVMANNNKRQKIIGAMTVLDEHKENLSSEQYRSIADGLLASMETLASQTKLYILTYLHLTIYMKPSALAVKDWVDMESESHTVLLPLNDEDFGALNRGIGLHADRGVWRDLARREASLKLPLLENEPVHITETTIIPDRGFFITETVIISSIDPYDGQSLLMAGASDVRNVEEVNSVVAAEQE